MKVKIVFEGDGSPEESALVNQIAHRFAKDVAQLRLANDPADLILVAENARQLEKTQRQNLATAHRLVNNLGQEVGEARMAVRSFESDADQAARDQQDMILDLKNQMDLVMSQTRTPRCEDVSQETYAATRTELNEEMEALRERERVASELENEVELELVRKAKSEVLMQLAELDDEWKSADAPSLDGDQNFSPGPLDEPPLPPLDEDWSDSIFSSVSNIRPLPRLDRVNDALNRIDVIGLKSTIAQVEQTAAKRNKAHDEEISVYREVALRPGLAFIVEGVNTLESKPMGGMPPGSTLLSILIFSLIFGSVVALNYEPKLETAGFASESELAQVTGIPVLVSVDSKSDPSELDDTVPIANLIVYLAKLTLLAVLVVIAAGLAFSDEARTAFASNPFYGLSKIMWNLLGK